MMSGTELERAAQEAALRVHLVNFATWLLEGEFGEGKEEKIVDNYLGLFF